MFFFTSLTILTIEDLHIIVVGDKKGVDLASRDVRHWHIRFKPVVKDLVSKLT